MESLLAYTEGKVKRKEIAISEYKGIKYIQIREKWRKDEEDQEWKFSKKVVSFNKEQFQEIILSLSQFFNLNESQIEGIRKKMNELLS